MCCVFSSHLLAAVPLLKARRALHFAVYLEDYTVQCTILSKPTRTNRGHTGGGLLSFFFFVSFLSHRRPLAVLAFIFYREICCFGSGGSCARERKRATHAMGIILNSYFCAMGDRDGSGRRGWHVKVTNDVSEIYIK